MELVTPGIGLVFWMLLSFSIVLILLKKYAWKPVMKALKDRENSIENALKSAEKAKEEMAQLQIDNKKIIDEAKIERDKLIKEAREVKERIINEAKGLAVTEANKLVESARLNIQNEKLAAISEMKNQIAIFSVEIAEKILSRELIEKNKQKDLLDNLLKEINLN
jgi:F-type H+-transporting ATPase subunit b